MAVELAWCHRGQSCDQSRHGLVGVLARWELEPLRVLAACRAHRGILIVLPLTAPEIASFIDLGDHCRRLASAARMIGLIDSFGAHANGFAGTARAISLGLHPTARMRPS